MTASDWMALAFWFALTWMLPFLVGYAARGLVDRAGRMFE